MKHLLSDKEKIDVVIRLLGVPKGEGSIESGERIVAEDIVMHMDGFTTKGRSNWKKFIKYFRYRSQGLHFILERTAAGIENDVVTFMGLASTNNTKINCKVTSRFRLENDQVVEIWTHRSNYTTVFGNNFTGDIGFFVTGIRGFLWNLFN